MDFYSMKRRQLQDLCKKHNLPANKTNLQMAESLSLIFKDETKSVESSGEIVSENGSGIVAKRAKKVRFCLEERKIEVIDLGSDLDDRVPKETRRKSILKPQPEISKQNAKGRGNSEEVEEEEERDVTVRVTRSRARKSMVLEEPLGLLSSPVKSKKSRVNNNGTENVCRNDKVHSGSSLLGDGVSENIVVLENDVPVRRSLRSRSTEDVCPERRDTRSTRTRKKIDVGNENIVPMTRNLRSRKIDVCPEKMDTNLGKTTRGEVREDRKNMEEVEDIGIVAKKSVKKKSNTKIENGDAVAKKKTRSDETKIFMVGQEEIGNSLETGEAVKQLNIGSSPKQLSTKTELVSGAEIPEKPCIQFDKLIRGSAHENRSIALVSTSEYVAKVEGNKRKSNYQEPRRRSQRRAPKSITFAPNIESVVQPEEEDEHALQFEDPRNCNAPRPRHESSSLVSEDQNIAQSKSKMVTKSKGLPRRSRRNKVGNKLGEPLLEEVFSLDALVAEDSRLDKSEDIVHNDENSPSNHLVNADEGTPKGQSHCDDVVLMEKESIVIVVDNLSLPGVSDQLKEITNRTIPVVEEIINENCGEDASMVLKRSQESAEISENHDVCTSDTAVIKSEDYVSSCNLERKGMSEGNSRCENDTGFVEGDTENLERFVEEHDDLDHGASPVHGVAYADSVKHYIEDDISLDEKTVSEVSTYESSRGIACDGGNERKSPHVSLVETNVNDVESEIHFPESVKQVAFQEEADEEVPQMIQNSRMCIQQSGHQGNGQYCEISANEHKVGTECCVADIDAELEDHKAFVSEGGFGEHEVADDLFKSLGVPCFDIVEARGEDGNSNEEGVLLQYDGNAISVNVAEDTAIRTQIDDEIVDISEADHVPNKAIRIALDECEEEHELDLLGTGDKIIVEGQENSDAIQGKFMISGQEEKDASAEEPKEEGGGELDAAMQKELEFPGPNDVSEDSHVGGTEPLGSQVHFSFTEENQMNEERIEENCVCENNEALAGKGEHPGSFQPFVSSEMVDIEGAGQLGHAHVNPVSNEPGPEENRPLKDKPPQTEITNGIGGIDGTDCGVGAITPPQIELVMPLQDCFSTEQSGTMDDGHWIEILSSQHTEPRQSWSAIDDQNEFNHGEVAEQEESVHTIDEPILDHLKMRQRNEVSYNKSEVREYAASGTRQNIVGDRHVDDIEYKEINNTSQVIPQANESTAVDEAERHLVYLVKKVQNDARTSMGECIAIMEEDGLHKGSGHQSDEKVTERCVSKLENIFQIVQKSEKSTKPTVTELDDNKEEERCSVGRVVYSTDSKNQDNKENMVEYDLEPDKPVDASSVLQQPRESVLAELSIINDSELRSPFEMLTSSSSAGRNLDDHSVLVSGSIVCHHHSESQEVSREAIINDLEDVERASDVEVVVQSVNRNFAFEDIFENVQLSETFKLEISGKFSEKKGSDHIVEENEGAMEQYTESKLTGPMVEEKLEAKASSVPGVKENVGSCLINLDVDDNEVVPVSVTAKYCTEYSETRDTIDDVDNHGMSIIEPTIPFTSHVDELSNVKDAENEDMSAQIYSLELADYEDYDGKVQDAMSVPTTLKEPSSEYDDITENYSNVKVEGNCILMDSRTVVREEGTSSSPSEISSDAHELLGSNEVLMKADLDGPTCNYVASENFGDQEYACQVFPESHCTNEDHNTEQDTRTNDSDIAVLDDTMFDFSGAEIKKRTIDVEDLIKAENISESSLKSIKASASSVRTSPCQEESEFQSYYDSKDDSRMRNSFISSIDVADDRGDNVELQDCASSADFPHLLVDQAEDHGVGTNDACNANATDQENDDIATFSRSPFAVEKEECYGPTPGSVVKEDIKDINSLLRKMHISSTIKWRGYRASTTPTGLKKSFEDHDQLAFDMKENIVSMKCIKSGNYSEKQSAFKRRALEDLQGSKRRDQSCYTTYKQQ